MKNFQFEKSLIVLPKGLKKGMKLLKSTKTEVQVDEKDLKSSKTEFSKVGQRDIHVHGWESRKI